MLNRKTNLYWHIGPINDYVPTRPVYLTNLKKSLEIEILNPKLYLNYSLRLAKIIREHRYGERIENHYLHLWWLFYQADQLICTLNCQHCGKEPIAFITITDGRYLGSQENNCCENCLDKVRGNLRPNTFMAPLKFSSITLFETQTAKTNYFKTILKMFGLPEKPEDQEMFEIFIDPKKFWESKNQP